MNMSFGLPGTGSVQIRDVTFYSGEYKLRGRLFCPHRTPTAVVVLNGATGVPARFYEKFGRWLAGTKGMACLTYDYRDFGTSVRNMPRQSSTTISDWGIYDQEAARSFAVASFPSLPLWVIGHSLGAMCLPFQRNLDQIDRVIAVASGLVHFRDHPWPYQGLARLFWFGPLPVLTMLAGYMPGRVFRVGEDLPSGVYWQWRRWCTQRGFYGSEFGKQLPFPDWTGVQAPAKFVAVSDDVMTPPETVWRLMQCYPSAPKTQLVLRPGDFGLQKLGHINVFSEKSRDAWDQIVG
ncbi:alpha/beta hydrolase family protein [Ruegeria atlantica]|uniref:alpha/beta hydrolase family protein n=1 Tax=Ruegeria atlantica TaxID=81569 RepID=UPI0020C2D67D|nr:alpha/beta fold hydrolase [Ruegeria atlantica]